MDFASCARNAFCLRFSTNVYHMCIAFGIKMR